MDMERFQRLSGICEKATSMDSSKKNKDNNTTPKNKSFDDVHQVNKGSVIDNEVVAVLDDIDDNGVTVKDGKKDINGNKVISKGERLTYTISIDPKTGAPKVDDVLKKDLIDVETWGESAQLGHEGFLVASVDGVYICHEKDDQFIMTDERSKAVVFNTIEEAEMIADLFTNSSIRRIAVIEEAKDDIKKVSDCTSCKTLPCDCDDMCSDCDKPKSECVCEEQEECDMPVKEGTSNMAGDIKSKLEQGQEVRIQVTYQDNQFSGWVKAASDGFLDVQPTPKTVQRYGIKDKTVKLPIDPNAIFWDEQNPSLIRGAAKSPRAMQQPQQPQQPQRKPFFPGAASTPPPQQGNANDSSTWQVDMSSKQYDVRPLTEYIQNLKESKKRGIKVPVINNLVAKHAHTFNKAATHEDRKKAEKRGKAKYKKNILED